MEGKNLTKTETDFTNESNKFSKNEDNNRFLNFVSKQKKKD